MVAIVGASGVGKSTLLHVLGGLDRTDSGRVAIGDADLTAMTRRRAARRVPQPPRRVRVSVPSSAAGVHRARERRDADADRADAGGRARPRAERRCSNASAWRAPRASAGHAVGRRAAARRDRPRAGHESDVLLADEPTGDLDEHTADSLHALLREMHRERGLTSIIATHNPRLAAACDRVLRLEDGQLKAES